MFRIKFLGPVIFFPRFFPWSFLLVLAWKTTEINMENSPRSEKYNAQRWVTDTPEKKITFKLDSSWYETTKLIIFNHVFFSFTEHHQQHQNLLKAEEDLHFCDPLQSLLTLKFLPWKILAKRSRTSKITMHKLMTLTRINPKVRNVFYQLNDHFLKKKSANFDNRNTKKYSYWSRIFLL